MEHDAGILAVSPDDVACPHGEVGGVGAAHARPVALRGAMGAQVHGEHVPSQHAPDGGEHVDLAVETAPAVHEDDPSIRRLGRCALPAGQPKPAVSAADFHASRFARIPFGAQKRERGLGGNARVHGRAHGGRAPRHARRDRAQQRLHHERGDKRAPPSSSRPRAPPAPSTIVAAPMPAQIRRLHAARAIARFTARDARTPSRPPPARSFTSSPFLTIVHLAENANVASFLPRS